MLERHRDPGTTAPRVPSSAAIGRVDAAHAAIGRGYLELFSAIAQVDRDDAWRGDGARDLEHWVSMRYGVSLWKARRWTGASRALEHLPRITDALACGRLGVDKALELARFALFEDEASLIEWALRVTCATVRHRADVAVRTSPDETVDVERHRFLRWWHHEDGRRVGFEGDVPAADGAIVVRTLERISRRVPAMPGEEDASFADARRADALVALCSERIASDPDRDRATIVIHADAAGAVNGETEDDGVVPPETVRRLLCTSRIEVVRGDARLGPAARLAPAWMLRQVRYRDRGCTFPGCGARRFTDAHHIRWWRQGGRTTPENLALVCSFHHRLVHEHGWRMRRGRDGAIGWLRPSGDPWPAGPIPDPGRVPSLERARRPAFDGSLDEPVRLRARPRARAPSRPSSA